MKENQFALIVFKKKIDISLQMIKIAKVIPSHKKESKLEYSNYRPISLLSNLDKNLEN